MVTTLAGMLSNAKGGPIDFKGKSVMMSCKIPVFKGQEVFVEILKYNRAVEQGFEVSVDQRKGFIEVDGQKIQSPIFWTKTAPRTFNFRCYPEKNAGVINIWNVWENIAIKNNIDAWIGHAGLFIEKSECGAIVFHCSNGIKEVDFEDLVFKVEVLGGNGVTT